MRGGVVQSIYSTNAQTQFDILDFDDEELESDEKEEEKLNSETEGMVAIY